MFNVIFRTSLLYLTVIIVIRLMGKRQVGELQPFELAITIMISALAAFPMEDIDIPLVYSLVPILLMLSYQVIISHISLKYTKFRTIISGRPSIIIKNGELQEKELRQLRISLTDLFEQLRLKGYHSLEDIEYAVMETTGELSIIPSAKKRNLRPEDIGLYPAKEKLPIPLIIDGKVEFKNLKMLDKDEKWLNNQINNYNAKINEVFYAALDTSGNFICQKKEKR